MSNIPPVLPVARRKSPERQVSKAIVKFLHMVGCSAVYSTEQGYRPQKGGTRTSPGIPDLIVFGTPELPFFFIEVKAGKGRLRPSQIEFQLECSLGGVPHLVAWDVRDVFDFMQQRGAIEGVIN